MLAGYDIDRITMAKEWEKPCMVGQGKICRRTDQERSTIAIRYLSSVVRVYP